MLHNAHICRKCKKQKKENCSNRWTEQVLSRYWQFISKYCTTLNNYCWVGGMLNFGINGQEIFLPLVAWCICASLFQGFRGRSKNCYSIAIRRVHKALQYQYVSRRLKKREMRSVSSNKETKRYMLIVNLMSLCRHSMWIITFRLHTAICWPVQHCILLTEKSMKYVTVDYCLNF